MKIPFRRILLGLSLLTLWLMPASALGQDEIFQQGNQRYQEGDFAGALEAYQAVLQAGFESADLYYNLGNAYFKTGELGPSILNYERAHRLRPGDADIQANLDLARSLTADEIEPLPRFWVFSVASWWVDLLPRRALALIVLLSYLAGAGGLCVRILTRREGLARKASWLAGGSAAVLILMGATLLAREGIVAETQWAIVLSEEVAVQSAPSGEDDLTLFHLHEGTKVRLDQVTEDWSEVVLEDGRVGWVPTQTFETI